VADVMVEGNSLELDAVSLEILETEASKDTRKKT